MTDPNDIELQYYGWTEQLRTARLRADPSGIQDARTALQAVLLPGLTTVTISDLPLSLARCAG